LAKLRCGGLVETRRERQTIYYSCNCRSVERLLCLMEDLFADRKAVRSLDTGT
jgi:DNA-binding transcriptional ArsR family regulator